MGRRRKRSSRNDIKEIKSWASDMNVVLLDRFRDVFGREPNEDDDIQLCETDLVIGMQCNGEVFAIVDAVNGRVYSVEDFGLQRPCVFVEGQFKAK